MEIGPSRGLNRRLRCTHVLRSTLSLSRSILPKHFLDTETTGLAGGAGTLPFLTGIARFEGEQFVVEQLLVENYGLEVPSLEYLRHRLNQRAVSSRSMAKFLTGRCW